RWTSEWAVEVTAKQLPFAADGTPQSQKRSKFNVFHEDLLLLASGPPSSSVPYTATRPPDIWPVPPRRQPLKLLDEALDCVEPDPFAGFETFSGVFHVGQRRNSIFAGDRRSV